MMKTILFNAYNDEDYPRRLDLVLDLARYLDGHLTLLNSMPFETTVSAGPYGAAFAAMVPIWREEARNLRKKSEVDLANENVPWDWIEDSGPVSHAMLRRSALTDIIVLGAREPRVGGSLPSYTAGEIALTADCPVLVLPENIERLELDQPALVAWDGSAEASHALRAATPLLKRSKSVFLVTVAMKKKKGAQFDFPPIAGAEYLSRHGIECDMVELQHEEMSVAQTMKIAAAARRCGLIVMGAYGRMRITERIFGGVTHDMLSNLSIPLLLRH